MAIAAEKTSDSFASDMKVISLIGVAHFFSHFYILLLPPLFPMLTGAFQVGFLELGLFVTAFSAATGVSQIPFGYLVDRYGAKWILIGGLALEALAFLLIGVSGSYWAVLILMAGAGIANGVYHPADYAILSASVSEKRIGRAFSLHTFTGFMGFAVAPMAIITAHEMIGWRNGLILFGAAGLVAAVALVVFGRSFRHEPGADRRSNSKNEDGSKETKASGSVGIDVLFSPPVLMCMGFFMLLALGSGGINNFLVSSLNALRGTPIEDATLGLTGYLLGSTGGILLGGIIADKTEHHNRVAACCFALTAVAILVISAVDMPVWLLVGLMFAQGLVHGIIMPSRDMIVRSVTPPGAMGKVFGFVSTGFSIAGIVAPVIFGYLLDLEQPQYVFYMIAAFMALSMLTVFTVGAKRQSSEQGGSDG